MTDNTGNPFDDNEPDLEGCTNTRHCHKKRSPRQEDSRTEEGRFKACHRPAGWGTDHVGFGGCKLHGGSAPNSRTSARRQRARQDVETLGLPLDVGPADALLTELQHTAGHVAYLREIIRGLQDDELVWGMVEETTEPDIRDSDGDVISASMSTKYKAAPNIWYVLYKEERKHLATVAKMALDAGVDERMVRMLEQVGDTFITLIERVITRIPGLTQEQHAAALAAVGSELRALSGGQAS